MSFFNYLLYGGHRNSPESANPMPFQNGRVASMKSTRKNLYKLPTGKNLVRGEGYKDFDKARENARKGIPIPGTIIHVKKGRRRIEYAWRKFTTGA